MKGASSPGAGGRSEHTFSGRGGVLEDELRRIAREEAQAAVRTALRDLPGSRPKFTTIAAAARRGGVGASTLRRWVRSAGLKPQANGRYLTAELDQVVAGAGKPLAPTPPALPPPADLAAARARRVAEKLRGGRP